MGHTISIRVLWTLGLLGCVSCTSVESTNPIGAARGQWVGGFDLGERRIPYILRIEEAMATLDRIDGIGDPFVADTLRTHADSLRIAFVGAGGNPWCFVLYPSEGALRGVLAMQLQGGVRRFPADFRPLAALDAGSLQRHRGDYRDEQGTRLHLADDVDGTLIAYLGGVEPTRMLFPIAPDRFVGGSGPTRADSTVVELAFAGDRASWTEGGRTRSFRRLQPELPAMEFTTQALRYDQLVMGFSDIPAGSFEMGQRVSNPQIAELLEVGPLPADLPEPEPLRRTTLTRGFRMAQSEVTNAWFRAFVDETGHMTQAERAGYGLRWNGEGFDRVPGMSWRDPGFACVDDAPVVHVSWHDAVAFCDWLSLRSAQVVRLPSEAEWEYACGAGSPSLFAFGDELARLDAYAWSNRNAQQPQPVAGKLPNAWNLYDLHGNVWEWCLDGHAPLGSEAVSDPLGPSENESKILRGGSWINGPWSLRSAYRGNDAATLAEPHIGFRVVMEGGG